MAAGEFYVILTAHRCGDNQSAFSHVFRAQLLPQRRNLFHDAVSWPSILRVSQTHSDHSVYSANSLLLMGHFI